MNIRIRSIVVLSLCLLAGNPALQSREIRVRRPEALQRAVNKATAGDTIVLQKGVYRLRQTLLVEGKSDLVIRGEGACLSGGVRIPLRRLHRAGKKEKAEGLVLADGVQQLNLQRYPVGAICPKGDPHLTGPAWSELYADGVPLRLSEWPDGTALPLDSVVVAGRGHIRPKDGEGFGTISFREDRPMEWQYPEMGWLWGCFRFGWTSEMVPIARRGADKTIEAGSLTNYGFGRQKGEQFQRWKVLNIPEEVTVPGEYALDIEHKRAWVMLPEGTRTLEMSVMEAPLVRLVGCNRVVLSGLELSCSRGDGVKILSCRDTRLEDCRIHGMGHAAATVDSASRTSGLSRCELYDLGAGAVELAGGDRKNIVRGDNYVENCRIHNYNRIEMQYRVGVVMSGLGNRVSGCEIYQSATMALLMLGNDQTVEYNNIHHVCMDIEDNGALYYGRNPTQRGSVIRWNYVHDIEVPFNVRAFYHDDGSGAAEVYGNILRNITSPPVQIGGGSDIRYHDNIFMDLPCAAVKTDGRLKTWGADRLIAHRDSVALVDGPAFRAHYPEFASYYEGDPAEPQRNEFIRNALYNVRWAFEKVIWSDHFYNDDISGKANFISTLRDNWKTTTNPGFIDPNDPLKGYSEHPPVLDAIPGFVLPPVARIPATSAVDSCWLRATKATRATYGFSGIAYGVADEAHTPAGLQQEKFADLFGFLPGNDAQANSEALQRCLDGGGTIRVRKAGVYDICRTLKVDAGTRLSFDNGVILRRTPAPDGTIARFVLINRGAFSRTYDKDICISGLNLCCNGLDAGAGHPMDIPTIVGLNCQLGFFYVKHLHIDHLTIADLPKHDFALQICTFEDAVVEDVRIEGMKDAVHFGPGRGFAVRRGIFKTYDDPIALNAHDYTTSNPELGWIENGIIEDCTDLDDPEHGTTGFFARILAGGWRDWESGMDIQSSGDAVVCGGRIYRSNGPKIKKNYTSTCRPDHPEGTVTYPDGITWTLSQTRNLCHSCGVRNVVFRDIRLQKKRHVALCLHFDHDQYSRSYYPYAEIPVQSNIVFERVSVENEIPALIQSRTPVDSIILRDSRIGSSKILMLNAIDAPGMQYDTTLIRLERVEASPIDSVVVAPRRPVRILVNQH